MLKTDLHLHTAEDPVDRGDIEHSAKEIIDYAAKLNFDVISITNHNKVTYNQELKDYADKKGILLIPGAEIRVNGKEVLIYNLTQKAVEKIKTFDDLRKIKTKNNMVIAPHPYFALKQCLNKELEKNIDVFDAVEYSHFYLNFINKNEKAVKTAKKYKKPLIGTSDAHLLLQMNHTYSLINSRKNILSVIEAVKKNKTRLVTNPVSFSSFLRILLMLAFSKSRKFIKKAMC